MNATLNIFLYKKINIKWSIEISAKDIFLTLKSISDEMLYYFLSGDKVD